MATVKPPAFSSGFLEPIPLRLMVWQGTTALHRFAAESLHLGPEPLVELLCTGVDVLAFDDQGHHEEAKKRMAERWALRAMTNREVTTTTVNTRHRL